MAPNWQLPEGARVHRVGFRVYIEDTDAGGIVYYANHLKFAERGRTEMLRAAGISHARMMQETKLVLTVRRCDAEFLRPAELDDEIVVETAVVDVSGATLSLKQRLLRGETELSRLEVLIACLDEAGKPRRLPAELREAIKKFDGINNLERVNHG